MDAQEVVNVAERHRDELLAILFPVGLVLMFITQSELPIIPITATMLLLVVVAAFYGTLFSYKIDIN
jgi:hypothetical protein